MKSELLVACIFICCIACGQSPGHNSIKRQNDTSYTYRTPSIDGTGKFYMGREIARVMDASGADWLERPQRPTEENTQLAIAHLNLPPDAVVADIGAGTGYYTFRITPLVPKGKVYAVELQDELIKILNKKKTDSHTQNIEVIKGDTLQVNLPVSSVDMAIMVDVYHELSWPREIIQSVGKSLKPDGKLLLIEYRGEDPAVQIKPLHKSTVAQLRREMNSNGFVLDYDGEFMRIQHFLVFKKTSFPR